MQVTRSLEENGATSMIDGGSDVSTKFLRVAMPHLSQQSRKSTLELHLPSQLWVLWFIKDSFFINPGLSQIFDSFIHHHDRGKVSQIQKYASYSVNKISTTMYDIPKNSEKWVESEYEKIESLGIVLPHDLAKGWMSNFQTFYFMTYYILLGSWKWGESNGTILIT